MACHPDTDQGNNLGRERGVEGGGEGLICQNSRGAGAGVWYGIQMEETFDKLLEVLSESLYHSYTKRHAPISNNAE